MVKKFSPPEKQWVKDRPESSYRKFTPAPPTQRQSQEAKEFHLNYVKDKTNSGREKSSPLSLPKYPKFNRQKFGGSRISWPKSSIRKDTQTKEETRFSQGQGIPVITIMEASNN